VEASRARSGICPERRRKDFDTMADLVAPGAWWLHRTRGSNVYLVEALDGRLALVDTGFGSSVAAVLAEVGAIGGGRPLSHILLTHSHFDHAGAARDLRRRTGALTAAGRADCHQRRDGRFVLDPHIGRTHVGRWLLRKAVHRRGSATIVDLPLDGEVEVLPGIVAVPVPGHTPGSYCYLVAGAGAAFVGDIVISHPGRLSRPLRFANADDGLYLRTLREFAARAPQAGCPGHGRPVTSGFDDALRELADLPRGGSADNALRKARRRVAGLRGFATGLMRRRQPPGPG